MQINSMEVVNVKDQCYLCRNHPVEYRVTFVNSKQVIIKLCLCVACACGISNGKATFGMDKLISLEV